VRLIAFILAGVLGMVPTSAYAQPAPDVVMLDELVSVYEPVPFNHKAHASMAEMWRGCETCHHRTPAVALTVAASQPAGLMSRARTQANATNVPGCKECHEVGQVKTDIRVPNLKGAYHRQCLNCHRDWAGENGCAACHRERRTGAGDSNASPPPPSVDDIVGRMHPPIPEPDTHVFKARFTPAVGSTVLFRHKEHTARYGIGCATCHHRDTCSNCHDGAAKSIAHKPLRPGRTWKDSHGPCIACHERDGCRHCHYDEPFAAPPAAFDHRVTGQLLDSDHANLRCGRCHATLKSKVGLRCGGAECHRRAGISFPEDRPGVVVTTRPTVLLVAAPPPAAGTQPATRPVVRRIRRGGS
jgi:hypothetical protein